MYYYFCLHCLFSFSLLLIVPLLERPLFESYPLSLASKVSRLIFYLKYYLNFGLYLLRTEGFLSLSVAYLSLAFCFYLSCWESLM